MMVLRSACHQIMYYCAEAEVQQVTLGQVLSFFTGAERPPPMGFDEEAGIWFSPTATFPTASTCALELTLPTKYHDNADMFHEKMLYGLQNHGGFGML